ncbi:MAG TPA: hypothetical protein VGA97_10380 [Acidimicrobiia bacterium]
MARIDGLDLEPLKVVRDISRSHEHGSVGGPLQVAKVYRNLDSKLMVVKWPDKSGTVRDTLLQGRFLLEGETVAQFGRVNPDSLEFGDAVGRQPRWSAQPSANVT